MLIRGRTSLKAIAVKSAIIFLMSAPMTLSHGSDLTTLPDWNDEANAYSSRGLDSGGARMHIADGTYSANQLGSFTGLSNLNNTHNDTEGDDLWTAYQMYRRLDGIHQVAADAWYTRAQNLAGFFKTSYVNGNAWNVDSGFNFDHLYGWGLCSWIDGESDTSAISTINQIVSEMVAWNQNGMVISPGESLFGTAAGGRRWGRQLRFAACAAEVSPTTANRNWRDRVIDIVLQAPDWNSTYNMYFLGPQPTDTDSRLGAGAYGRGDRISITYHMGIVMDGLWHAWRVLDAEQDPRAGAVRQRLIDMATFYRDIALDGNGFLQLNMGYNVNTGARISHTGYGTPVGVYSLAPVNGLVMAYKLTGDQSFLNRAWTLYRNWQTSLSGSSSSVDHFVDADLASGTGFQFLANNKGELQYVYALFENGGNPTPVSGAGPAVARPMPPVWDSNTDETPGNLPQWYANAASKTWIDMRDVGASSFNANDPTRTFPDWDFGTSESGFDYHTGVIDKWNGAVAREDYLVIALAGGHRGSPQNTIFEFGPFSSDSPSWHWYGTDPSRYDVPSHHNDPESTIADWSAEENKAFYSDGRPSAAHTYDHQCFIPDLGNGVGNTLFAPFMTFVYSGTNQTSSIHNDAASIDFPSVSLPGGRYEPRGTYPNYPGRIGPGGLVEWDPNSRRVWIFSTGSSGNGTRPIYSFDPVTKTYTMHADDAAGSFGTDTLGGSIDPIRQIMIVNTNGGLLVIDLRDGNEGDSAFITSYSGDLARQSNIGVEYEPTGRTFVGYSGGSTLYTMTPPSNYRSSTGALNDSAAWSWEPVTNGSGSATPSPANSNGTYGRFRYISSIKAFAVINNPDDAMYVYKIPPGGL